MMEDFSGLALPPLFGGHILEAELEPGGVELGPGEGRGQGSGARPEQEEEKRRELEKRKYLALIKRCKEIEQTLDAHGDDYRNAQLTILLEEESGAHLDISPRAENDRLNDLPSSSPSVPFQSTVGSKKKRHRVPKQEKDPQTEADVSMLAETQFSDFPSPTSLSH
ncbi:unnamed protein product [Coregonus sp. 'balchen']|nr:unnamed protein product [Coregonus sp. 'balchen']